MRRGERPDWLPPEDDPQSPDAPTLPRLYLREPGWHVAVKAGSEKMHCYQMAPGQSFYHRITDGEVYLVNGDERLCLPCADRRGLLHYQAKGLREPVAPLHLDSGDWPSDDEYEVKD